MNRPVEVDSQRLSDWWNQGYQTVITQNVRILYIITVQAWHTLIQFIIYEDVLTRLFIWNCSITNVNRCFLLIAISSLLGWKLTRCWWYIWIRNSKHWKIAVRAVFTSCPYHMGCDKKQNFTSKSTHGIAVKSLVIFLWQNFLTISRPFLILNWTLTIHAHSAICVSVTIRHLSWIHWKKH